MMLSSTFVPPTGRRATGVIAPPPPMRSTRVIAGAPMDVFHYDGGRFEHADACRLSKRIMRSFVQRCSATALTNAAKSSVIVIDLSRANDASTAAFAHLVLLRTTLLKGFSDLKIAGLRDRAEKVYVVNRLNEVLPRA